jgi:RimJ/RimL family protein N-acetyltransferase
MCEIDLQPTLVGSTIRLRPLQAGDFAALYGAASDPKIWELHPDSKRYQRDVFKERYFDGALASRGALIIEETATGRIIGSSRYYEWDAGKKEIAIGFTFIERAYWNSGTNRELKQLMLDHIYQWATTVWFHIGKNNARSRRAVEKLGATLSHEEERELGDKSFTQLYYKLQSKPPGA